MHVRAVMLTDIIFALSSGHLGFTQHRTNKPAKTVSTTHFRSAISLINLIDFFYWESFLPNGCDVTALFRGSLANYSCSQTTQTQSDSHP